MSDETTPAVPSDDGDRSLLELVDRLTDLLNRSDLTELEVTAGETKLVLRKPSALAPVVPLALAGLGAAAVGTATPAAQAAAPAGGSPAASSAPEAPARPSVKAPLTGIWYTSPSPGAPPYVEVGREVAVGQVIGLIEAMKLFNEIKSDLAGRVVKICAESGKLVKTKGPLIEVEPL
jgi:acetyl-CoA carboxylase biotin carboxyl carrier protein